MPSIASFNVTPVKGLALEHPYEVRLEPIGVPGNRLFFLVDAGGKRISSTRHGNLVTIRATYDEGNERLSLLMPGGGVVQAGAAPGPDAVSTDFWGRDVEAHIVPGPFAAALSDFVGEDVRLARCDRDGDGIDVRALTVMSLASVVELGRQANAPVAPDPRRFRMTIELDGCDPHEEDSWAGRRVRLAAAVIRVGDPVPRCVVTTRDPDTGQPDFDTLKVIRRYRGRSEAGGLPFGMYAEVEAPGAARVGDSVEILD